jgi:hypothetical protein
VPYSKRSVLAEGVAMMVFTNILLFVFWVIFAVFVIGALWMLVKSAGR